MPATAAVFRREDREIVLDHRQPDLTQLEGLASEPNLVLHHLLLAIQPDTMMISEENHL